MGVPAVHCPLELQASAPLHALPSAQLVPAATGVWLTPVEAWQLSAVQGLPSSRLGGTPTVQAPDWQVSLPLQAVASAQEVPSGFAGLVHAPVAGSQVPAS
jgi:hypothetical protein